MKSQNTRSTVLAVFFLGYFYFLKGSSHHLNFKITHQDLRNIGATLGYKGLGTGMCFGFSMMCANAVLVNEEPFFFERLVLLDKYKARLNSLLPDIEAVRTRVKRHQVLTAREKKLLEVVPFFDSLALYQDPQIYRDFFNHKRLTQSNVEAIYPIAKPLKLEHNHLSVVLNKSYAFDACLLSTFLEQLSALLHRYSFTAPLILCNQSHAVFLAYKQDTNSWMFIDINDLEQDKDTNYLMATPLLIQRIFKAFNDNLSGYSLINLKCITLEPTKPLVQELNELDSHYLLTEQIINRRNNRGRGLLSLSICNNQFDLVNKILKCTPLIDENEFSGLYSPLILAVYSGSLKTVELLLDNQSDPNQSGYYLGTEITPLSYACFTGELAIVKALINKGADPNQITSTGLTPLIIASEYGFIDIASLLLDNKADPNLPSRRSNGYAALHVACQAGHFEVVALLIQYGACVNQVAEHHITPLMLAYLHDHHKIVSLLLEHHASPSQIDSMNSSTEQRDKASQPIIDKPSINSDHNLLAACQAESLDNPHRFFVAGPSAITITPVINLGSTSGC